MKYYLVLDVGTTGVKALLFTPSFVCTGKAYVTYPITSKQKDWVEQSPQKLLNASTHVLQKVLHEQKIDSKDILSLGITNQRETTILWDRETGKAVYPAIVWQDTRTRDICARIQKKYGARIRSKTGLSVLPYFSASKIAWILEHAPKAQRLLRCNKLLFGTVESWLLWHLCKEHPHVTDPTNASRTLLMNIQNGSWDPELLGIFDIPTNILPEIHHCKTPFGKLKKEILGREIPVTAVCGDQQSSFYAASAQQSHRGGVTKITYGTGVFLMQSLGKKFNLIPGFFTTRVPNGPDTPRYALEAKIGISGPEVAKRLNDPKKLRAYFYALAKQVDREITKLPVKPKVLLIDGGSSRDGLIIEIQEEVSGIPARPLVTYDGTALGTAILQAEAEA